MLARGTVLCVTPIIDGASTMGGKAVSADIIWLKVAKRSRHDTWEVTHAGLNKVTINTHGLYRLSLPTALWFKVFIGAGARRGLNTCAVRPCVPACVCACVRACGADMRWLVADAMFRIALAPL